MRFILCYAFLLSLQIIPLKAQLFDNDDFRAKAQEGMDQMYNLSFESAGSTFYQLLEQHPEHPAPYFFLALNRWWQTYLAVTMPDYYGYIEDKLGKAEERLELIKNKPGYDREYIFFKFMIHALDARANAFQNEWWSAMNAAKRLVDPMEKSLYFVGQDPEFYMVAGLYHYYVETYHQQYPVIRPILSFFPDGDVDQGLKELVKASEMQNLAQVEATYFLGTIYSDETKQPQKALAVTRRLHQRYPGNTWFKNDYAQSQLLAGNFDQSQALLDQLIQGYTQQGGHQTRAINSKESRYTTYLMVRVYHNLGRVLMEGKHDYQGALQAFEQSNLMATLADVEADPYLPGNQYYTGLCYDYLGQRDEAVQAYENVLDLDENALYAPQAKNNLQASPVGN